MRCSAGQIPGRRKDGLMVGSSPPRKARRATMPDFEREYRRCAVLSSYGHTTVKAPHPIRTAKLSTVGPDQYYGRGLRGNLMCCKALFYFLRCVQLLVFVHACDAAGVLAQSEACVLSKHEVLGSKPRYSSPIWCSW